MFDPLLNQGLRADVFTAGGGALDDFHAGCLPGACRAEISSEEHQRKADITMVTDRQINTMTVVQETIFIILPLT